MSQERKQRRIDRYRELAEKNHQKAHDYMNSPANQILHDMAGEPVKIDHHSERRHRKLIERARKDMDKSIESYRKAEYYEEKAAAAENNTSIYSDDEDAIIKLQSKIAKLKENHEEMKRINALYRKCKGDIDKMDISDEMKEELKQARENDWRTNFKPFPTYKLTNSNATIKHYEQRLEKLKKAATEETTEIIIGDIIIIDNVEKNRVQIIFPGKPSDEIRAKLKRNGFRWSRKNMAWQRHKSVHALNLAKMIVEG